MFILKQRDKGGGCTPPVNQTRGGTALNLSLKISTALVMLAHLAAPA
jgi:hypothetical protein